MEIKIHSLGHGLRMMVAVGAQLVGAVLTLGLAGDALSSTGTIDEETAKSIWTWLFLTSGVAFMAAVRTNKESDPDFGGSLGRIMGAQFLTFLLLTGPLSEGRRITGEAPAAWSTSPPRRPGSSRR